MSAATKRLGFLLVFSVVYADIGTSIFYVSGLLWGSIGGLSTLAILLSIGVFVAIARKYVELAERCPDGGGVVSITTQAFPSVPLVALVGGSMITIDYFLTSAISSVTGVNYLKSLLGFSAGSVLGITLAIVALLMLLNIVGLKESATVSAAMAIVMLLVNLAIIAVVSIRLTLTNAWPALLDSVLHPAGVSLTAGSLLVGYADTWLAYSGLESGAQLSGAMKMPVRKTASLGMWLVIGSICFISPLMVAFSNFVLPTEVKAAGTDAFISHLASTVGGRPLMVLTVVSAALLLTMACNTAIVGNYHVNLRLVSAGFLPPIFAKRNLKFGTPHYSIAISAVVPMLVLILTLGNVEKLADLYSFGLLGTLVLDSFSIDVLRFREKKRGMLWLVGVGTTVCLAVAWFLNMYFKWHSLAFGASATLVIVGMAMSYRTGLLGKVSPLFAPAPATPLSDLQVEALAAAKPQAGRVLTVEEAVELQVLERSGVVVALRGFNDRLLKDAALLAKGAGQANVYAVYVDELPGLFFQAVDGPSAEANQVLQHATEGLAKLGVNGIPIWRISNDAAYSIADAATRLGADAVLVGTSKRSAIWNLLRGQVVKGLAEALPEKTRLLICN
ncbi:MAG TPA: universal stress protein [Myxococcales bacterium]|jgi:amino acid transporter/nucleotide-binding universal stress UspA family protein